MNATQKKALIALLLFNLTIMVAGITGTIFAYIAVSFSGPDPEHPLMSGTMLQQLLSIGNLTAFFAALAVGPLAARFSKKIILLASLGLYLLLFAVFLVVGLGGVYTTGSFIWLIVGVLIGGIAQGLVMTTSAAAFGDFLGAVKAPQWISIAQALGNGGGMLANIVAGYIAAGHMGADWPKAYWIGAILIPVFAVFLFLMPGKVAAQKQADAIAAGTAEEGAAGGPPPAVTPDDAPFPWLRVIGVGGLTAMACIFYVGMMYNVSVYVVTTYELGTTVHVGYVMTTTTLVGMAAGLSYAVWAKVFKTRMVTWTYSIQVSGLACLWLFHDNLIGAFLCATLMGFGFAIQNPWVLGFLMAICPRSKAPVGMAALNVGASLGLLVAPFINNPVANLISGGAAYGSPEHMNALLGWCTIGFAVCIIGTWFVFNVKGTPLDPKRLQAGTPKDVPSVDEAA
jgi:MFS family permease